MKTFGLSLVAIILGVAGGAALAYWEASPWEARATVETADLQSPSPKTADVQPRAVVAETVYNFGKMESSTMQRRTFPIRNEGVQPLNVTYVAHTCKCTTVEINGKKVEPEASLTVKPGDAAEITLEWAAKQAPGPFRHGATFTTNDPQLSRLELMVEGEVVDSTSIDPPHLYFGDVRVGEEGRAEMTVMAFLDPEVKILSHEVTDEELAKRIEISVVPVPREDLPNPEAQAGAKVVAVYKAGGRIGQFSGSLKLETNLKGDPRREVPIFGVVKGDITITGKGWVQNAGLLRMDPATTAEGGKSLLRVAVRGDQAETTTLRVDRVEPAELKAELGQPKRLRENLVHFPLTVSIPPGTRPMVRAGEDQGGEGEIILATSHPLTPEVRLRVVFTVQN